MDPRIGDRGETLNFVGQKKTLFYQRGCIWGEKHRIVEFIKATKEKWEK